MRIALVGTRGVPARYGGFETCVEEVGQRLASRGHDVVVYCRGGKPGGSADKEYLGMKLVHLPAPKKRSLETLVHTGLSVGHIIGHRVDAAIVFNAANAPWLPALRAARIPVATHVDGLEWRRAKWGPAGKMYYRLAEAVSVKLSDALIADARGIQDYYSAQHAAESQLISYGAPILGKLEPDKISSIGLAPGQFHLVVARFEPENHVDTIVQGYVASDAKYPLVVVGSAPYSADYTRKVSEAADSRVRFLGGVWDQELLNQLYAHALVYWHGHSVGGTNPSLLRAIGAGAATNAFDINFNREVLGDSGEYFSTPEQIPALVHEAEGDACKIARRSQASVERAREYSWDDVADRYESLCRRLASRELRRSSRVRVSKKAEGTDYASALPKVGA
ncbi:DUF1972 domain-containing protein [Arthrobacter sp. GMC3]|uniref:DUF1972 domain-containing protein n=1 Tax=Arthrobacter sp. GMC3 TaxID=2058894 RepID=UPI000CE4F98D|nr:DUF1972 domain-containing protein [Arthrobacter sp. GMC3]